MSGDTNKVSVLSGADVLYAELGADIPDYNEDFDLGQWSYLGLLGEDGIVQSRSRDSSDKYALGGILVATRRKNFKQTVKFTVLEENEVTDKVIWPGSTRTYAGADYHGTLKVPDPTAKYLLAFVIDTGDGEKRFITSNYAQTDDVGDLTENDEDLPGREVTASVYPDVDGNLFITSKVGANPATFITSIDVQPATTTKAPAATQQLTVTATYSDSSTEDVTQIATYSSSAPSKATVDVNGKITAVATGSATITATFLGQTDTCAVTVS